MKVSFKPANIECQAKQISGAERIPPAPIDQIRKVNPSLIKKLLGYKPYWECWNPKLGRWVPISSGDWFVYTGHGNTLHLKTESFNNLFEVVCNTVDNY